MTTTKPKPTSINIPPDLHALYLRRSASLTMATGQRVSVHGLMLEALRALPNAQGWASEEEAEPNEVTHETTL